MNPLEEDRHLSISYFTTDLLLPETHGVLSVLFVVPMASHPYKAAMCFSRPFSSPP